ncbi:C-X-C motif chemokine 10-like [Dromaius novaehollandiae]|uniref:C-X-C motif chemokine n=1 Tax=Dromaius novaehollandiae TaxID=8790 RepID=A0A8C4JL60_DRONO|nr:C-X-C motif chemokine 10-like [Dromaius novaehollandiae]
MNKAFVLVLCFMFVVFTAIEGDLVSRGGECLCIQKGSNFVYPKLLQKIELFPKSAACERIEIIATMKQTGKKRCLNPDSKQVKFLMKTFFIDKAAQSLHQ